MLLIALAHYFVFSHTPYVDPAAAQVPCVTSCLRMLDLRDVYGDVREHFVDPIPRPKLPKRMMRKRRSHGDAVDEESEGGEGGEGSDDERKPLLGQNMYSLSNPPPRGTGSVNADQRGFEGSSFCMMSYGELASTGKPSSPRRLYNSASKTGRLSVVTEMPSSDTERVAEGPASQTAERRLSSDNEGGSLDGGSLSGEGLVTEEVCVRVEADSGSSSRIEGGEGEVKVAACGGTSHYRTGGSPATESSSAPVE